MQRSAALSRIEKMRFNVRPKINQPSAPVSSMRALAAVHSQRVEVATAASTHVGHKEVEDERPSGHRSQSHRRNLHKVSILNAHLDD
jgi:hypothetical protein